MNKNTSLLKHIAYLIIAAGTLLTTVSAQIVVVGENYNQHGVKPEEYHLDPHEKLVVLRQKIAIKRTISSKRKTFPELLILYTAAQTGDPKEPIKYDLVDLNKTLAAQGLEKTSIYVFTLKAESIDHHYSKIGRPQLDLSAIEHLRGKKFMLDSALWNTLKAAININIQTSRIIHKRLIENFETEQEPEAASVSMRAISDRADEKKKD